MCVYVCLNVIESESESERELRIEPQNTGYDSERERLPSMNEYIFIVREKRFYREYTVSVRPL